MTTEFDDIRPYTDEEIPSAMSRIAGSQMLPLLASYVCPEKPLDEVRQLLLSFKTIRDFQYGIMHRVNEQIIANSITEFSFGGTEYLEKGKPYLLVSNHRDIMLDASLLQNLLVDLGLQTSQITFGANLMMNPLVVDIGKSNKMFRVERGATPKEFYRLSLHLSDYIRHTIQEGHSVWIAQRNGRTKDGNDKTDQGIIKMFGMSGTADKISALDELNILPVSVSYEWEPCDVEKALELYQKQTYGEYHTKPGEDIRSIMQGILQPKGRVHFEICPPVDQSELVAFHNHTQNEYHQQVARLIDRRICAHYRLWPNNYIAHDRLYGDTTYRQHYTDGQREAFDRRLATMLEAGRQTIGTVLDEDRLVELFLGIYANPVNNKMYD